MSDVIGRAIHKKQIFTNKVVWDYVDVGTSTDWFDYNDKPVVFCDIDGTIIVNQGRVGKNSYFDDVIPLNNNINKLLEMNQKGAQFIFTTARDSKYHDITENMLKNLGFKGFTLISGLQNSRRILINDYNEANPYPRAVAVNIYRNADNLNHFL